MKNDKFDLPSIDRLREVYDFFHETYFDNKYLDWDIKIEWSKRLTSSAGNCTSYRNKKKALIKLSVWYYLQYPEDIERVLLHEMIHIETDGHGKLFKKEIERIRALGGEVNIYSKGRARKDNYKWEYTCNNCNKKYVKMKKFDIFKFVCSKCGGQLTERKLR